MSLPSFAAVIRRLALLLVVFAQGALAQPAPGAVVGAWQARTRAAVRGVDRVEADEEAQRRIEGPRGTIEIVTAGRIALRPDGPVRRAITQASVDGAAVAPERLARLDARFERAFGRGFAETTRDLRLLPRLLEDGRAVRLDASDVDGRPAWRVAFALQEDGPAGSPVAEAWFTRSADTPRLLRVRLRGERRDEGFVRTVDYTPAGGLDVPAAVETRIEVRQRRRLRSYTTLVTIRARYAAVRVLRR